MSENYLLNNACRHILKYIDARTNGKVKHDSHLIKSLKKDFYLGELNIYDYLIAEGYLEYLDENSIVISNKGKKFVLSEINEYSLEETINHR